MTMAKIQFSEATQNKEKRLAKQRVDSSLTLLRDSGIRQDALQFSKNQLDHLARTIYEVIYSNPRDAFAFMPLNTEVADGATEYSYRMIADLGAAAVVADGATDRPLVDADLTKTTIDIYEFGSGYTYTVGDQARSGAILDFGYVLEKARIAAETIALAHNEYGLIGGAGVTNGNASITGFLNNATVVTNIPTLSDVDWSPDSLPTGDVAYASMVTLLQEVNTGSAGAHSCTDLMMSTYIYNYCAATLMGDGSSWGSSQTVLSALRQNFPEVTFHKSASGTGRGAAGIDRCVAWERNAANAEYVASVVYDESTPINSGFRWTIHSRGRAAGCVVRRPLSMAYGDITVV